MKNKNFIIIFLMCFLGVFCVNNSLLAENTETEFLDNNKSPFPQSLFDAIQTQIYNTDTSKNKNEELRNDAIKIIKDVSKNFESNFKGIVYSLSNDFDLALSFQDLHADKYFKSNPKSVLLNFKQDSIVLESMILKNDTSSRRKISFINKKNKLMKAIFTIDSSNNVFFMMIPDFGEEKIQAVVMCPRKINSNDVLLNLNYNEWVLNSAYERGTASASMIINDLNPSTISAGIYFSNDMNRRNIVQNNQGSVVSVKANYEPTVHNEFILIDQNLAQADFPRLYSYAAKVDYENNDVKKEAFKRVAFEIKKFDLPKEMKFAVQNGRQATVAKGLCYTIVKGSR